MTATFAAPATSLPGAGIFYVDASAWVKAYLTEAGTVWMHQFGASAPRCCSATLGLIEVIATVIRRNTGAHVPDAVTDGVLDSIRRDYSGFTQIHFGADVMQLAQEVLRRRRLRGADGIHLASALYLRRTTGLAVTLIASDVELQASAQQEGFPVLDPAADPPQPIAAPYLGPKINGPETGKPESRETGVFPGLNFEEVRRGRPQLR